jgi:hypothetical protein
MNDSADPVLQAINFPEQTPEHFSQYKRYDTNILTPKNSTEVIKINGELYALVGQDDMSSVYSKLVYSKQDNRYFTTEAFAQTNQDKINELLDLGQRAHQSIETADELNKKTGLSSPFMQHLQEVAQRPQEQEQPRFMILGEKGAQALDLTEESTRRLDNLAVAREMEAAGKTPLEIRVATEWERGADNLWRYEINDTFILKSKLKTGVYKLKDLIEKEADVLKAFPELKNLTVVLKEGYGGISKGGIIEVGLNDPDKTFVHELQHEIQVLEGFSTGMVPMRAAFMLKQKEKLEKQKDFLDKFGEEFDNTKNKVDFYNKYKETEDRSFLVDLINYNSKKEWLEDNNTDWEEKYYKSQNNYLIKAGEVEARNVEERMSLSPQERLNTLLQETEDVAREDQLILFEGLTSAQELPPQSNNIGSPILQQLSNQLLKLGTVTKLSFLSPKQLQEYLTEKGISVKLAQQVLAWHGSPHNITKFSTDAIGTGEGAQAFGWGLYFTDLENIGKTYAKRVSGITYNGINLKEMQVFSKFYHPMLIPFLRDMERSQPKTKEDAAQWLEKNKKGKSEQVVKELKRKIEEMEIPSSERYLYRTTLFKDKAPDEYNTPLWDKGVTEEQHSLFKEAAKNNPLLENTSNDKGTPTWREIRLEFNRRAKQAKTNLENERNNLLKEEVLALAEKEGYKSFTDDRTGRLRYYSPSGITVFELDNKGIYGFSPRITPTGTRANVSQEMFELATSFREKAPELERQIRDTYDFVGRKQALRLFEEEASKGGKFSKVSNQFGSLYQLTADILSIEDSNPQKTLSLFLLEKGIDGIKYPAESAARGATSDTARGFNYVVFDENAITIEEVIRFQTILSEKGLKLTPQGLYNPSTREVIVNEQAVDPANTMIHEFAHAFFHTVREKRPDVYQAGMNLVNKNKKEAQAYIDLIKQTQPNLVEGTQEFSEELLTSIVADNGSRLVKSKVKGSLSTWLEDLWTAIKDILGLSSYTAEQVSNMTIQQFSDAVLKDMFSGQDINELYQEAQEYFTREADRLPLTLSVFSRPEFTKLQGSKVKPITVLNLLNQQGIKQIEKDLIKQIIDKNYPDQKQISYDELEATVRANIMPLERLRLTKYSDYGMDKLGDGDYGKHSTIILNAPVEHGVTGHFSGDFNSGYRDTIKYIPKQLNDNVWIAVDEKYNEDANPSSIYEKTGFAGTKEQVQDWIDKYNNIPIIPEYNQAGIEYNIKTIEDEEDGNYTLVTLVKEGLFVGEAVYEEGTKLTEEIKKDAFQKTVIDKQLQNRSTNYTINTGLFGHVRVWRKGKIFYTAELQSDTYQKQYVTELLTQQTINSKEHSFTQEQKDAYNSIFRDMQRYRETYFGQREYLKKRYGKDFLKEASKTEIEALNTYKKTYEDKKQQYEKEVVTKARPLFSKQEKQFIASQKEWEKRMVRETIKEASLSGATELRFPTPYTLSVIEGYVTQGQDTTMPYTVVRGDADFLVAGDMINYGGESLIVVDINDEEMTVVAENKVRIEKTDENWNKDLTFQNEEGVINGNTVYIYYKQTDTERLSSPNQYYGDARSRSKDNFSIEEDLSETQQTVARKYLEIADILKEERGSENFTTVTDENGFDWYSTKLTENDTQQPVVAFNQVPITIQQAIQRNNNQPLNLAPNGNPSILYRTYQELGYDTQETERLVAQTYSDQFGEFFGRWWENPQESSKVVDANMQPLVVWHGSPFVFNEFSTEYGKYTKGTFFSTKLGTASIYGNTRPFFIKANNIKEVGSGLPGVYDLQDIENTSFDGLWNKGTNEVVVGKSNQIKSATENIGTFSTESNDIRFSVAPVNTSQAFAKQMMFDSGFEMHLETEENLAEKYDTCN